MIILLQFVLAHLVVYFWLRKRGRSDQFKFKEFVIRCLPHAALYVIVLGIQQKINANFLTMALALAVLHETFDRIAKNEKTLHKGYLKYSSIQFVVVQVFHIFLICFLIQASGLYSAHWNRILVEMIQGKIILHDIFYKTTVTLILLVLSTHGSSRFIDLIIKDLSEKNAMPDLQPSVSAQVAPAAIEATATLDHADAAAFVERNFREKFRDFEAHIEVNETIESKQKHVTNNELVIVNKISYTYSKFDQRSNNFSIYIGILERLIIAFLVFKGATTGITFLVTLKALARYKQFDDKVFAQYFLLGTLFSALFGLAGGYFLICVWN